MNLIYHYTSGSHLDRILESKELIVSEAEKRMNVKPAALWLSLNPDWEPTATKRVADQNGSQRKLTKKEQHELFGLIRFVLEFKEEDLCSWFKYQYRSNISKSMHRSMEAVGIKQGAKSKEWYASFKNIPLTDCISYQKWDGQEWLTVETFKSVS